MFTYRHRDDDGRFEGACTTQGQRNHARRDHRFARLGGVGTRSFPDDRRTPGHTDRPRHGRRGRNGLESWRSQFEAAGLDGIDAVVHLAGENIASRRWGAAQKKRIRDSRVNGTRLLCEGLARMQAPPKVLISASAIGYYGDRTDESLDESSPAGDGFLAEVAEAWEAAAEPAVDAGIRVVNLRFGVILSPKGGALAKMLTPFKLGGGGIVGNGRQYWSWISIDDVVGAIHHVIMTRLIVGTGQHRSAACRHEPRVHENVRPCPCTPDDGPHAGRCRATRLGRNGK